MVSQKTEISKKIIFLLKNFNSHSKTLTNISNTFHEAIWGCLININIIKALCNMYFCRPHNLYNYDLYKLIKINTII